MLKGRFYWLRRYHGGLQAALEHFQQAIQEDAGYALAHAGVADAYAIIGFYSLHPPRIAFGHALAAAERALAIDPDLPEAHTSVALVSLGDWDWAEATRQFARALELDSTQVMARIYWSWLMVLQGDIAGAVDQARTAQQSEPLSPLVNGGVAHTFYLARRYEEAIAECEKSLEVDPNFILAIHVKGMCRALQGRLAEAVSIAERTVSMSGGAPFISAYWVTTTPGVARPTRRVRLSSNSTTWPATGASRLIVSRTSMQGSTKSTERWTGRPRHMTMAPRPSTTFHP